MYNERRKAEERKEKEMKSFKLNVGTTIYDKYGRTFIVVEFVQKTGANGETYTLYNLYPPTTKPKIAEEQGRLLGLHYEPYLYISDEMLKTILKKENNK